MPSRPDRSLDLMPAAVVDYRERARRILPRQLFDYIDGGAYDEVTLRANVEAFRRIRLRQRVLRDVSRLDLRTTVLDQALAMPVVLAPVGLAGAFALKAEVKAARAAESAGIAFCESTVSICSIEEVGAATRSPFWFQLYVMRDREYAKDLMQRAHVAGCPVLVLTVDLAVVGARYRDLRNGLGGQLSAPATLRRFWDLVSHARWLFGTALPARPILFGNLVKAVPGAGSPDEFRSWVDSQFDAGVTWKDVERMRAQWPGKLVLKGILDVEDARAAVAAGADGIVVSNHGGRQLDSTLATVDALAPVVDAVGDRTTILVDGGVRSGLDVVKALALGAKACLVGRAWAYAVAARGRNGVEHVLRILRQEMEVAMALTGVTDVKSISRDVLV